MCDHVTLSNLYNAASKPDAVAHRRIDGLIERVKTLENTAIRRSQAQARTLRAKGWTIREVAEMLDVSQYRVRQWTTS